MLPSAELDLAFARVADGDRTAFAPVFTSLYPRVRSACSRITANEADADDAAQAAMMKLFEQAHRYEPGRSVVGWALTLAVWEARTVARRNLRRGARVEGAVDLDAHADAAPAPDELLADAELHRLLDAAIADLSPGHRAAVEATLRSFIPADAAGAAALRKQRQRAVGQLRDWFTQRLAPKLPRTP